VIGIERDRRLQILPGGQTVADRQYRSTAVRL